MDRPRETAADALALLAGGGERTREGLAALDAEHRDRVAGWLRSRFPGMSSEDLADAWSETLLGVLRAVREGRLDTDRPLSGWLLTVAYRRAADLARRNAAWRRLPEDAHRLLPGGGSDADPAGARAAAEGALADVREAILRLPGRQRVVMQAFVDGFPETRRLEALRTRIRDATGERPTIESVKGALREARKKIRRALARPDGGGE